MFKYKPSRPLDKFGGSMTLLINSIDTTFLYYATTFHELDPSKFLTFLPPFCLLIFIFFCENLSIEADKFT